MDIYSIIADRPLTDPELVRQVLRDTLRGPDTEPDLGFMLCDLNGRLVTPLLLAGLAPPTDPAQVRSLLDATIGTLCRHGSVASYVVRHGPVHATAPDLQWQEAVQRYCAGTGVRDLGFFVVGTRGVDALPRLELVA
ncbi:hypothetical protein [Arsenicicoccus sp. oral taxon 190]|uniref:hypothetical protein n=1 Tax=Arsenicicoccus sp. oral taxon 190 TaxID=1658671 RepID=UPI00067A22EB|nr:hypothetical protein [Arsenicicoccus sp. oral taxon 190]AKT50371.1 hypothetical protein ADJ73_01820 [Arsenicicoccus sp. oral taxon 190]